VVAEIDSMKNQLPKNVNHVLTTVRSVLNTPRSAPLCKANSEMNQPNVIVKMDTMVSETKPKIVLNVPLNVEPVP
jgi:hypothetical protein